VKVQIVNFMTIIN